MTDDRGRRSEIGKLGWMSYFGTDGRMNRIIPGCCGM